MNIFDWLNDHPVAQFVIAIVLAALIATCHQTILP